MTATALPVPRALIEQRAVAWLQRALDCFDPFTYPPADRMGRLAARKALAELAAVLLSRRRAGGTETAENAELGADMERCDDAAWTAMLERLEAIAARRPYRDLIARQHRSLWLYGLPYAALRAWGRDDAELRWMIEQAVAARYPVSWERLPYRHLDYLHFLEAAAIPHRLAPVEEVLPHTLLHASPNVAELEEDDVYAITHTIFYVTQFGLADDPWPAQCDRETTMELVETLLEQHAAAGHTDLTAELLICAACLHVDDGTAVEAGWRLLGERQSASGAIPAPEHLVPRAGYSGEREDAMYGEWKRCYHTTAMTVQASLCATRSAHSAHASTSARRQLANASQTLFRPIPGAEVALARAIAWLRAEAAGASPWRALLAAAGAAAGYAVATPAPLEPLDAAVYAATRLAGTRELRSDVAAGADLLALLSETRRQRGQRSDPVDALLSAGLSAGGRVDVDPASGMSGADALVLARTALAADSDEARRVQLSLEAVRALRAYRLGDAAASVSALVLAGGAASRTARNVTEALLAQQRFDGSFGYAATEVEDDALATVRVAWTARTAWMLACQVNWEVARPIWEAAVRLPPGG